VLFDEYLAGLDDVGSFAVIQPDGFDVLFETVQTKVINSFWCVGYGVEFCCSFVYAFVCRLMLLKLSSVVGSGLSSRKREKISKRLFLFMF
jgi:hypothetical protein